MDNSTEYFDKLDKSLIKLGKSDSAIEYAPHIRNEFDKVISALNMVKLYFNKDIKDSDSYFE